jgi:hypothetical protein
MLKRVRGCMGPLLAAIVAAMAGCQSGSAGPTGRGAVRLEVVSSKAISVRAVEAYVAGDRLVVRGKVRRMPENCCMSTRGAFAILLVGPDGEVIDTTQTSWAPRNIPKGYTRGSTFTATLPYVPAEDFRLRITPVPE